MKHSKAAALLVIGASTLVGANTGGAPGGYYGAYGAYGANHHNYQQPQQYHRYDQGPAQQSWYGQTAEDPQPASKQPTAPKETPPLPAGWTEHFDPNSGQYYYYHAASGTSTWDKPEVNKELPESVESKTSFAAADGKDGEQSTYQGSDTQVANESVQEQAQPDEIAPSSSTYTEEETTKPVEEDVPLVDPSADSGASVTAANETSQELGASSWDASGKHRDATGMDESHTMSQDGSTAPHQMKQQPDVSPQQGYLQSTQGEPQGSHGSAYQQPLGQHPQGAWDSTFHSQQTQHPNWGAPTTSSKSPQSAWGVHVPQDRRDPQQQQQQQQPLPWGYRPYEDTNIARPGHGPTSPQHGVPQHPGQAEAVQKPHPTEKATSSSQEQQAPRRDQQQQQVQQPLQSQRGQNFNPASMPQQQSHQPYQLPRQGQPFTPGQPQHPGAQQYMQQPGYPHAQASYNPYGYPQMQQQQRQGHYAPGQYGQQGYGQPIQQQPGAGQIVSKGLEESSNAIREAIGTTWSSLVGFGSKTRELSEQVRDQVVSGATAAGQSLSTTSTSMWDKAKTAIGSVFEGNGNRSDEPGYSMSGYYSSQTPPGARPPQGYPGQHGMPPPQQQGGRYGPGPQGGPHGGYPMQPRTTVPYPHMQPPQQQGRPPMQSQYTGNQNPGQQGPPQQQQQQQQQSGGPGAAMRHPYGGPYGRPEAQGGYPPQGGRPGPGAPQQQQTQGHPYQQPNPSQGQGYYPPQQHSQQQQQQRPQQQQQQQQQQQRGGQPDPWSHPGLSGEL
eukprot:Nitzschia sp. Nitz4//scaffold150_size53981//14369//16781//NITZ4_006673-RA/size53981-snap-gene-0.70-mRNA-1//-1//CDS//3329537059//4330//frame0